MAELASTLGPFFAVKVSPDAEWAKSLVRGSGSNDSAMEL